MKGLVRNTRTNTLYKDGAMIGETDIFFKNMRREGFMVEEDSHLLKMEKADFEEAIDRFSDLREEVEVVAREREKLRNEAYRERLFA
jgi:CRP-like cAMP-binding protein